MSDRQAQNLIARAQDRMSHGDLDGAVDVLQELLGMDPDHVQAHALLALCFVDLHAIALALREAEEALALDPQESLAHRAMAAVCFARRSFAAAAAHIEAAIDLDPHDASSYEAMAQVERVRGRPQRPWLDRAIALEPEDPEILAALADERLDVGALDEARAFADEALGIDPLCVDALLAKARVLLREGDPDDAREHVVAVLRANAVDHDALRLLVLIRARKNPALGLLMRWNLWLEFMEPRQTVAWLVGAFVVMRLAVQITTDLGWHTVAATLNTLWYAFAGYTWIAPFVVRKMLERELADVRLDDDY